MVGYITFTFNIHIFLNETANVGRSHYTLCVLNNAFLYCRISPTFLKLHMNRTSTVKKIHRHILAVCEVKYLTMSQE